MKLEEGTFAALGNGLLQAGRRLRCPAYGASMFPLIRAGQWLEVAPLKDTLPRVGDIIVYRTPSGPLVAHRVWRCQPAAGGRYFTRGDAFPWWAMEAVEPHRVLGRVVALEWRPGRRLNLECAPARFVGLLLAALAPILAWAARGLQNLRPRPRACLEKFKVQSSKFKVNNPT